MNAMVAIVGAAYLDPFEVSLHEEVEEGLHEEVNALVGVEVIQLGRTSSSHRRATRCVLETTPVVDSLLVKEHRCWKKRSPR
jgi:hypothetical protein